MRLLRLCAVSTALFAFVGATHAQFAYSMRPYVPGDGASLVGEGSSSPIVLRLGDRVRLPNGNEVTIGPDTQLPVGVELRMPDGRRGSIPYRPYVEIGAQFGVFSIAGPIPQSNGGFLGGTRSVSNLVASLDAGLNRGSAHQPRISVGGWYFFEDPQQGNSDLYQVHVRASQESGMGLQLGYLNSTSRSVPAVSLHALYQLESSRLQPEARHPWAVEIGVGSYLNLSSETVVENNREYPLKTLNFSAFTQARVGLNERVSLVGSFWFVRDRNTDWNRFGIGLAYRF